MKEFKAQDELRESYARYRVFLAGTIDNGNSENWQERCVNLIKNKNEFQELAVFNPRNDDWDKDATAEDVKKQAKWELESLEDSHFIIFNFLPNSLSPITLLELGLFANRNKMIAVICPKEYWRNPNVEVVCELYNIKMYDSLEAVVDKLYKEYRWYFGL